MGGPLWEKADNGFFIPTAKYGPRWTSEQIAKYLYPDAQTPEELDKAIDKVKKQYRAACKLICGESFNHELVKLKLDQYTKDNHYKLVLCDSCTEKSDCTDYCPDLLKDLAKIETKRSELLISNTDKDLEDREKIGRVIQLLNKQ